MRPLLQLALDFFAPEVEVDAATPVAKNLKVKRPLAPVQQARTAIEIVANDGATEALADGPAAAQTPGPAVFRHPQARRELRLGDALVGYALVRARRRSIGFTVGAEGLAVRAPPHVTLSAIDAVLQEKSGWILRKLGETRARARHQEAARIAWRNGVVLPFLGGSLCVQVVQGAPLAGHLVAGGVGAPAVLQLGLPASASADQLRGATAAWLGPHAYQHFARRLDYFAPRMVVRWQRLALTNASTRWGSARSDGSIRLNWRLMHFAPEVLDYVVVHELAHLHFMDHSPQFWATVEAELPDYRALRGRLKTETPPVWRDGT